MQHCGLAQGCTTCAGDSPEQAALRPSKSSRLLAPVWVQGGSGSCPRRQPQTSYHQLKPHRAQCSQPSSAPRVTINASLTGPWLCLWWICLRTGAWAGSGAVAEGLSLSSNTLCAWDIHQGTGVQRGDSWHLPTQLRSCLLYPVHQLYWEAVGAALNSSFVSGHHVMGVAATKS